MHSFVVRPVFKWFSSMSEFAMSICYMSESFLNTAKFPDVPVISLKHTLMHEDFLKLIYLNMLTMRVTQEPPHWVRNKSVI